MNIISSISVIIASLVAIYGINAWKREYVGKRKIELAEEVLAMFYEARDAIRFIRNPLGFEGEGKSRKVDSGETEEQKLAKDQAFVVYERYHKRNELFNKLHSLRYRFMVHYGAASEKPFYELNRITNKIILASNMLSVMWVDNRVQFRTDKQKTKHYEDLKKYEAIIWSDWGDEDPINPRIDDIISEIEKIVKD